MPPILMVSTIQVLVSLGRVFSHIVRPSKIWFILDSIYNPVYWFLEGHVHLSHLWPQLLNSQILPGPGLEVDMPRMIYDQGLSLISVIDHLLTVYIPRYASSTASYPREASSTMIPVVRNPRATPFEKYLLQSFHYLCQFRFIIPSID